MNIYGLNINTLTNENAFTRLLPGVFAHCVLEMLNGFDLVGIKPDEAKMISDEDKIYDVNFYRHNGARPIKAKLYLWHDRDGEQHGLVCSNEDVEANVDAKNKYDMKSWVTSGWTL